MGRPESTFEFVDRIFPRSLLPGFVSKKSRSRQKPSMSCYQTPPPQPEQQTEKELTWIESLLMDNIPQGYPSGEYSSSEYHSSDLEITKQSNANFKWHNYGEPQPKFQFINCNDKFDMLVGEDLEARKRESLEDLITVFAQSIIDREYLVKWLTWNGNRYITLGSFYNAFTEMCHDLGEPPILLDEFIFATREYGFTEAGELTKGGERLVLVSPDILTLMSIPKY